MEQRKRLLQRKTPWVLLLALLLGAAGTVLACLLTGQAAEKPLENGQVFRFRREAVRSVTIRCLNDLGEKSVTLETAEDLDRFVEEMNGFRYTTVIPGEARTNEEGLGERRLNAMSGEGREGVFSFLVMGTEGSGAGGSSALHSFEKDRVGVDGVFYCADGPCAYLEEWIENPALAMNGEGS